jgi:hypothetical protein
MGSLTLADAQLWRAMVALHSVGRKLTQAPLVQSRLGQRAGQAPSRLEATLTRRSRGRWSKLPREDVSSGPFWLPTRHAGPTAQRAARAQSGGGPSCPAQRESISPNHV